MKGYRLSWFNRYLVISVLLHIIILFLIAPILKTQPKAAKPLTFEIINPVIHKPKKPLPIKPKPVKIKAQPKVKPKVKPVKRRIRHHINDTPIDKTAKLSINKDGYIKKKNKKESTGENKKKTKNKLITPLPYSVKKTKLRNKKKQIKKTHKKDKIIQKSLDDFPVKEYNTKELFVKSLKKKKAEKKSADKTKPGLDEILANLDKYVDFDKYSEKANLLGNSKVIFDDETFHYTWYGRIIKRRVADGWYPPYVARMGVTGRTVITFRIKHDGKIIDIKIRESSGNKSLDNAALNAIESVGDMPELPSDYQRKSLGVVFSFWYNLKPANSG